MRRNLRKKRNKIEDIPHKNIILSFSSFIFISIPFLIYFIFFNPNPTLELSNTVNINSNSPLSTKNVDSVDNSSIIEKTDTSTTFTLAVIGNIMCYNTQYLDAYQKETGSYDFSYVFDEISYDTKIPDITIGSLETSFAGEERGYHNYLTFNTPDNLAYCLKKIGVDVLSTATNHCLDMGFSGLCRTLDILDDADISHLGTYRTQEEQEKILIKYVKGLKIAFVNYTYGTNDISLLSGKDYCVNLIDRNLIQKQLEQAKNQNADIIVACMHWGTDYQTAPNSEQENLTDFLFENGSDIIVGNHPYNLQPMEKRTISLADGTTKDGFVIYSLGNFMADQNADNAKNSIILNLTITKNETSGKISIDQVKLIPIYFYKDTQKNLQKFKILNLQKNVNSFEAGENNSISESVYLDLKKQLEKIKNILGDIK